MREKIKILEEENRILKQILIEYSKENNEWKLIAKLISLMFGPFLIWVLFIILH